MSSATQTDVLFGRISGLMEEIGVEKTAAEKLAMKDPGGADGPSSHPSTKEDDNELSQPAPEGSQSSLNETDVKAQTPIVVDSHAEITPDSAPKQDEVQLGQGVDAAKPTGEDPGVEEDYKGDKEDPSSAGHKDMGGTSHPATGSVGEKYSSWNAASVAEMSDESLVKAAAYLGNSVMADVANNVLNPEKRAAVKTKTHCPTCHKDYQGDACGCGYTTKTAAYTAAGAGYDAAVAAADHPTRAAAAVVAGLIKDAHHQADLVADHLLRVTANLEKQAMHEDINVEDPTGGQAEGEDHGSEGGDPTGGGEGEDILAAMGGGGGEMGGMPPEAMDAPPEEMGGMGNEAAVQQLAMALMELGIDPAELAAAVGGGGMGGGMGGPPPEAMAGMEGGGMPPEAMGGMPPDAGVKLAHAVISYKRSGNFKVENCKTAGERKVRDYMKSYVSELLKRSHAK
jgi:hypothetical protein